MTTGLLPDVDHVGRRSRLAERLSAADIAALVVTGAANVRWLTGFSGSNGQALVDADGAVTLITDGRYAERAATEAHGVEVVLDRDWIGAVASLAAASGLGRLGFEPHHVTWLAGEQLTARLGEQGIGAVPIDGAVEALRVTKDAHELEALRRACEITVRGFDLLWERVAPGWTERRVATFLERAFVDLGAEAPAFATIAAAGPNSAVPHHAPTARSLQPGDLLKVDAGARVAGYHADMTRTVAFGDPGSRWRDLHALVVAAQQRGVEAAVDGASAAAVDAACRDHLTAAGHGEHFLHGTGHGVGLDIHEAPAVAKGSTATLGPRTTLTVEPGVYLSGRGGIRIEDTVVVTPDGPATRLTGAPRDLLVL